MQLALGANAQTLDLRSFDLRSAVLYTLAYSDIFDYPLTAKEIHRYLIGLRATEHEVSELLQNDVEVAKHLATDRQHYGLAGRSHLFDLRKMRSRLANELWNQSLRFGKVIAQLPFVRMVAVTGALASDNVEAGADLDYLIVTKPGFLWLTRAMILALDRVASRFGQKARLCPNFLITEDSLALEDRDLFTAQELVRMVPIAGLPMYAKMLAINIWTRDFLPNAHGHLGSYRSAKVNGWLKGFTELALNNPATRSLENWEMRRKIAKFEGQQKANGETRFSADFCKGHFDGHKQQTMRAFEERISKIKLNGK